MNPDRWKQVEQIFNQAIELSLNQRPIFLQGICGDDKKLFSEVESLLQQDNETGSMLRTIISRAADSLSQKDNGDLIGKKIGPYRITGLVGQGGMAEVYKAVRDDDQYQKQVAIKIIRHDRVSLLLGRFWHERQILANLEHSNIACFLEGGTTDEGIPYLVMEFIEGNPITIYCDKYNLTIRQKLELFKSVCNAVQYAHRNLVIHRDLKPSNILVTAEGVPKLLDFGIAKLLNPDLAVENPGATVTSYRMMTPEYASPEQVRGEQVTTATDVYSL
ncbi:MAG TPA: serine/threonine-protein kinase, partial [Acidobacteriota bacterium]